MSLRMAGFGLLVLIRLAAADGPKPRAFAFSRDELGKVPSGWMVAKTGAGAGSAWQLVADESAPSQTGLVLMQTAASPKSVYNLCVANESNFHEGAVAVQFKAVTGKIDQGGGIVWRYQDANHYYIARMNPLEANYRVYKVVGGKRQQLATKEHLKVPVGTWHHLKIVHQGDQITCYLDGKKELEAADSTIQQSGKVGLWTKADAQTSFDRLIIGKAD